MQKLIAGIVDFRRNTQESYREMFGQLATGQSPVGRVASQTIATALAHHRTATGPAGRANHRHASDTVKKSTPKPATARNCAEAAAPYCDAVASCAVTGIESGGSADI